MSHGSVGKGEIAMQTNDIVAVVVTGVLGAIVVALSVVLLTGRGAGLIAGFGALSAEERAKYDTKKLCRFVGAVFLPAGLAIPCIAVAAIYRIVWLSVAIPIAIVALIVFAAVYCNTGNRFRK